MAPMSGGDPGPAPVPVRAAPKANLFAMLGILPLSHCTPPAPSLLTIPDHARPSITSQDVGGKTDESARYQSTTVPMGITAESSLSAVTAPLTMATVSTEASCSSPAPTE